MVQAALRCLIHSVHSVTNIYTEATLAYAFALAGDYEVTQELLYKLDEQAIRSGTGLGRQPFRAATVVLFTGIKTTIYVDSTM